ncbi:MAG: GNAT family N-acetyltransferase [Comamonadaceae bacterium]|nr:GNAT family N-acetyltransferase [Comamonadaceae bacterium]
MALLPILLTSAHAAQYRALMLQAYADCPDAFTSSVADRTGLALGWWKQRLSGAPDANERVWGVAAGDALAGVVGLSFDKREKVRHKAHLFGMFVTPEFRQRGLGGELLAAALQHARTQAQVQIVQLTVTQGNRSAQALYERHGFVEFGLEPFAVAVAGGFVAKSHMWCRLGWSAG